MAVLHLVLVLRPIFSFRFLLLRGVEWGEAVVH